MNLTAWIDIEAKVKFPITKQTLEKAIKLGMEQAKERGLKEIQRLEKSSEKQIKNFYAMKKRKFFS